MFGCGGSENGSLDTGFADPIDPNPPPDPNIEEGDEDNTSSTSTSSCSKSTVTDYWVSCTTQDTSTSCTTTSSMVAIGCDVTATTTTTGVDVCYSVDPNEDQGEDGGGFIYLRPTLTNTDTGPITAAPSTKTLTTTLPPPPTVTSTLVVPAASVGFHAYGVVEAVGGGSTDFWAAVEYDLDDLDRKWPC